MFTKVLIANRGAIAVRIIRTLKKLNIKSVAIYSEADRNSLHVAHADEAYSLGDGVVAETYLNQDHIFDIVKKSGAQAIHPGYGFLSENADFADRCMAEDVIFLGPTAEQMTAFGLKHIARDLAKQSRVPLLPGTDLLQDLTRAITAADEIGYPVMLKSTAGGGGIGMSRCDNEHELTQAFDSVKRLSENNFANAGIFLEKFIEHARHIEVQVFGDGQGNAITLGERDCSSQRRNQKVIEETPAPNIPDSTRKALADTAKALACSMNYRSAGTVEFIYDASTHEFYFLEVNTRLQVEHGVTEEIYGVDIVEWMIKLGAGEMPPLTEFSGKLVAKGHSIQVRTYAEDPNKHFQPSTGLLTEVIFPPHDVCQENQLRIDTWIETGSEVTAFFDPMLAKLIATGENREAAIERLKTCIRSTSIYGIETNLNYALAILETDVFRAGEITTRFLNNFHYSPATIDVLSSGTQTTIQDYPGRSGYWHIGIPPSGPFDNVSFRIGNQLLNNTTDCSGLEITLVGPKLKFNTATQVALTGAKTNATLNGQAIDNYHVLNIHAGDVLDTGKVIDAGSRAYLLVNGGLNCPLYLDSRSTFTLGQFGGHGGRAIRTGDVLHLQEQVDAIATPSIPLENTPAITNEWNIHVIYGPHGAPDFFTDGDIRTFFENHWEVHYNSSRTGIRLIGPKPEWARTDGGEAGMHPSNIHDNAYAIGAIDFTGDMPVILGPDGPSLGGFVCPATVIQADLWKLGQLKAGDKIHFTPVTIDHAVELERKQNHAIANGNFENITLAENPIGNCIIKTLPAEENLPGVVYRAQGDHYLLIEYGELKLDIRLRFRAHALMLWLEQNPLAGIKELTPGVRSLQVHYDSQQISLAKLLAHLEGAEKSIDQGSSNRVPARIVHLPLSWDDEACRLAIEKYMQSVRPDAPWCPSNIEFIRRINGLESIEQVKDIIFDANYLVLGLGDVYLGAPVATPMDPRHRLVTTKYNPARTWTAENSVGIGGSYMCIYGMEGPGGYQFVGRTLQMWNRYKTTTEFSQPWLLRFFDQIKFYEVSADELKQIRADFPHGNYPIKIEETHFDLDEYNQFLRDNNSEISQFTETRDQAFNEELERWIASGQINFESQPADVSNEDAYEFSENATVVESHVAGNIWKLEAAVGDQVNEGDTLMILESMKMEIEITAPCSGTLSVVTKREGDQVNAGTPLLAIEP